VEQQTQLGNGQSTITRSFSYDFLKRLTSATNPESGVVNYSSYDGNGNLLSKSDARVQMSMTYDPILNRLAGKTYLDGTPNVAYTYDDANVPNSAGRLTAVTSTASTWNIVNYDGRGRPTSSSQTTGGQTYTFPNYSYNLADKLTSITYPSLRVVNTAYDLAARPKGVSGNPANGATTNYTSTTSPIVYASHGAIQQVTLFSNLVEQSCYNNRLQPTGIRLGGGATTNCANSGSDTLNLSYSYGTTTNNGNLLSQTITRPTFSAVQTYNTLTPYDGVNRLMAVQETGPGASWSESYGYDPFGNRWVTSPTPPTAETPTAQSWYFFPRGRCRRRWGHGQWVTHLRRLSRSHWHRPPATSS
jgi:YD repeat-containing protein